MSEKVEWLKREPEASKAKLLRTIAWIVTALVLGLVVAMRKIQIPLPEGVSFTFLPPIYSALNAVAAVALVAAVVFIKQGKVKAHKAAIQFALVVSITFLLGYVLYHITTPETEYGGEGPIRVVYFILLITHIILAAVSFPFILFAYISGATNYFAQHKKMVKWVFPVWLYVAITGPVCYLMLKPYYGQTEALPKTEAKAEAKADSE